MRIFLLFWVTSATAVEFVPLRDENLPSPAVNINYEDGKIIEVTVDQWMDWVVLNGKKRQFFYHQGYNYKKNMGFSRTLNPDGSVYHEEYSEELSMMVSREEMIKAFEIFKEHPEVKGYLEKQNEPINLYGGFEYKDEEPSQPCYYGSRCVHIMASTRNNSLVIHSIVKLNDETVPYPIYDMDHLKKS